MMGLPGKRLLQCLGSKLTPNIIHYRINCTKKIASQVERILPSGSFNSYRGLKARMKRQLC
jgi:hypothetical protein